MEITIKAINGDFTVCKVNTIRPQDIESEFCFIGKTDEEFSIVCPTEKTPAETIEREDGWRAFRIEGVLDFSLIGILAHIADILAKNRIGIFVVSTFNTDYILVKAAQFASAMDALRKSGYNVC